MRTALMTFGERVLQARLALAAHLGRPVTQTEVAEAVGVHQVTLGEWERGKKEPKLDTIERLAAVLNVSPAWLAFGEGAPLAPHSSFPPASHGPPGATADDRKEA